jgi:hypothetical protein
VPKGIDPGWAYNPGKAAWGEQQSKEAWETWSAAKEPAWERLPSGVSGGNWESAGRPREIPVDAPRARFGPSAVNEAEVVAQLKDLLGGEQAVFRFAPGGVAPGLAYDMVVNAEVLGSHARARFNLNTLGTRLEELHERLAGVVIECLDFEEFLRRYDKPTTLFYLDPPYHGTESYYGKDMFGREDYARLASALGRLKGRFLLSINDCPEIRETFRAFRFEQVDTTYTVRGQGAGLAAKELLVSNEDDSRTRA